MTIATSTPKRRRSVWRARTAMRRCHPTRRQEGGSPSSCRTSTSYTGLHLRAYIHFGCIFLATDLADGAFGLCRWEATGGAEIAPYIARFTNQVAENLREESGIGAGDQRAVDQSQDSAGKDSGGSSSMGQSFDSYRSDLSATDRKRGRVDERNAHAVQKAMGEMQFNDKEEEASVAVALAKERTMKAAKVAEDLRANAESERYEMLLIETIQKLEDQMDPSNAKFREDPTGMWTRYLTKKRQQLLTHMGDPAPAAAPSPERLTPRSQRTPATNDTPFHAAPPPPQPRFDDADVVQQ
mmetsp:Transcript_61709/g.127469  ORF Transcript_61709/g.127469 Transcript_61709/m.127469 type:complete len:297 (+) Transcript_61709:904-1794(+)